MDFSKIKPISMQEAGRTRLQQVLSTFGCIPPAPDGPAIPEFEPLALAQAVEHELHRCGMVGWSKVTLHMDVQDAVALAQYLRNSRR